MAMDEKQVERLIGCVPSDVEDSRTIKEAEREAVGYVSPENMAAFLKHGMSVDLERRYWAGGIPLYTRPSSKAEIADLAQARALAAEARALAAEARALAAEAERDKLQALREEDCANYVKMAKNAIDNLARAKAAEDESDRLRRALEKGGRRHDG